MTTSRSILSNPMYLSMFAALLASSAGQAAVSVSASFKLSVIKFAPADGPGYFLFPSLQATGFTNDSNLNNYVRLQSDDHEFGVDLYPARGVGTGTLGSIVSTSVPELVSRINTGTGWTLTVVDGVTNQTRNYTLTVTTPGINADYIRPTTINVTPNTQISSTPSFTWTEPTATSPNSAWDGAFGGLYSSNASNQVFTPAIGASDLSWTPDTPLNPDEYTLGITKLNSNPPQTLIATTTPVPQGGAPALASFTKHVEVQSDANASGLFVPCAGPSGSVELEFTPGVIGFSPVAPPVFILAIGINASGFVDESNLDNYVKLESSNNHFSSDFYPARGVGSGTTGSIGLSSATELATDINNEGDWTLTYIDGTTGQTRLFTLNVTTPGFGTDYLRPLSLDVNPGSTISNTQTFHFSQAPTSNPLAQNTSAFGGMIAQNPSNSVFSPAFGPNDTSWTPATPLNPDSYTFLVAMVNDAPAQNLVAATTPVPNSPGACALSVFNQVVRTQVSMQSEGLLVDGLVCDSIDFNNDTSLFDPQDIDAFLSVYSEGPCIPETATCNDIDFNNDGSLFDPCDIDSFLLQFSEGPCTLCGV
ncbi:MAG: hypothetical protein U0640_01350 [Phycisphaerales bacterium]